MGDRGIKKKWVIEGKRGRNTTPEVEKLLGWTTKELQGSNNCHSKAYTYNLDSLKNYID